MPDQKVIEFEGQQHVFPADFTDEDIRKALVQLHPQKPATTDNWAQQGLDKGANALEALGGLPGGNGALGGAATLRTLAHPKGNAPTLLAGAATAATAAIPGLGELTIPALIARLTASGIGGFAGAKIRGDATGPAMQEGAGQMLMQGIGGELPGKVGSLAERGAQRLAFDALNPSDKVLGQMRDSSGRSGLMPGNAERVFKDKVLDVVPGRPGSLASANELDRTIKLASGQKDRILNANPQVQVHPITPTATGIHELYQEIMGPVGSHSGRSVNPNAAAATVDEAIQNFRDRPTLRGTTLGGSPITAPATPTSKMAPWSAPETSGLIKGLDDELNGLWDKRAQMRGGNGARQPTDYDARAYEIMRQNLSDNLTGQLPGLKEPNRIMSDTIPFRDAAAQATRSSGPRSLPRNSLELVDKLRRGTEGHLTRPLEGTGQALQGVNPQVANILMRLQEVLGTQPHAAQPPPAEQTTLQRLLNGLSGIM